MSPPGSPGRVITSVCQKNSPVRTSWALTKHFRSMNLPQPLGPVDHLPVSHDRSRGVPEPYLRSLPANNSSGSVQRYDRSVGRGHKNEVLPESDALHPLTDVGVLSLRYSQRSVPSVASSACTEPPAVVRKRMPDLSRGAVRLLRPSGNAQTHASCSR